jgi:hypothetical protein
MTEDAVEAALHSASPHTATPHIATPPTAGNWVAVGLMIVGLAVCTVAFIAQIIWLGIAGAVVGAAGIIAGKATHLMQHGH